MGKKRKNAPSLQDLLDRPICYYCERDFEDLTYLIDHMKAKHYRCQRCSRRLTTAGGLTVHMKQVHKEDLTKIENAMPGREKPDIEIFGMEGFPQDLLEKYKQNTTNLFFKNEQQQRMATGNPPRGTQPVASNPQKQETIDDMKARFAERRAQKAAEKAAGADGSGSGNNTPPVNRDTVGTPQNASAQNHSKPGTTTYNASGGMNLEIGNLDLNSPMRGYDVNVTPVQSYPHSSNHMLPASTYVTSAMKMTAYPSPHTGLTSRGPNPATMAAYPPGPMVGMSGSPPPAPFPHVSAPLVPPSAGPRQNSLPSAPGLPQRPAFDSPNVSKEDMAKMHVGPGSASPGVPMHYNGQMSAGSYASGPPPPPNGLPFPQYGNPNASYPGYPPNGPPQPQVNDFVIDTQGDASLYAQGQSISQAPNNVPSSDDIDDLIASVTGQQPQSRRITNAMPAGQPELVESYYSIRESSDSKPSLRRGTDLTEGDIVQFRAQVVQPRLRTRYRPTNGPINRSTIQDGIDDCGERYKRLNEEAGRVLEQKEELEQLREEQAYLDARRALPGGDESSKVHIKQEPYFKQEPHFKQEPED